MKLKPTAVRRMARQAAPQRAFPWRELPYQTLANCALISGRSKAHIYHLIHTGVLHAVTLGGRTLVTTASLVAFLEDASPWHPNRDRVSAAIQRRIALSKH
jgi:hypothetical protein